MNRFFILTVILLVYVLPLKSQIILSEIMASNVTTYIENDFYNFSDWIEVYNNSTESVNLSDFYLSDDPNNLKKWQCPSVSINANSYYLLFCDKKNLNNHTNFGLNTGGETIYLCNNDGKVIDQVKYIQQYPDVSFGRNNIDNLWYYCITPTPEKTNVISNAFQRSNKANYSIKSGRLFSSTFLNLEGNQIRYTTNGDEPEISSPIFVHDINVNKTIIIKTKSYQDGFLPGDTKANTYFLNEHKFTLPVISLSFNNEYFYDNTIGIYVKGNNGTAGYCGSVADWNQPWERAVYFEYFDENGNNQISQLAGVKVAGGCTRGRDQKSLSIYARSKYGDSDFDYAFFKQKPDIVRYNSVLLRNSGNDQDQTLLRDAFMQALVNQCIDLDFQSYQPVIVYLNGEYSGIMNLREKIDEDYFKSNYEISSRDVDFLERDREIIRGSADDFTDIINYINTNDMSVDANYYWVAGKLDVQEYINYMALQIYIGNRDWPGNNLKFWKSKENGLWRWIVFDLDYGFGFRLDASVAHTFESLDNAIAIDGPDHPNPPWSTLLLRKLLENKNFENQFVSTLNTLIFSSFEPSWCDFVLDSLAEIIDYEIYYNNSKYFRTKDEWYGYLSSIKSYAQKRHDFMPDYIESFFGLSSNDKVSVNIYNNAMQGNVEVNNVTLPQYPFEMNTYKHLPFILKALPSKGYRFVQWNNHIGGDLYSEQKEIFSDTTFNISIEPVFEPVDEISNIYINEITSTTNLFKDEYDEKSGFVELYNNTGIDAVLYSCFISDKKNNLTRYAIPDSTVIPGSGFTVFYLDAEAKQGLLHTSFKADNDGETFYLSQKVGESINVLDSLQFDILYDDHSYGRYNDSTGNKIYMVNLTPNMPNDADIFVNQSFISRNNNKIIIYPNPSKGIFNIKLDLLNNENQYSIEIVDFSGKVVFHDPFIYNNYRIEVDHLNKGMYLVRIFNKIELLHIEKIIIR